MMQEILVYVTVFVAVVYLFWKYTMPKKKKATNNSCGQSDCGCH